MIPQRQAVDLGGEHQLEADRPDRARIFQAERSCAPAPRPRHGRRPRRPQLEADVFGVVAQLDAGICQAGAASTVRSAGGSR